MDFKWIGAVLIVAGCGGFGFSLVAAHRREEGCMRSLMAALDYMASELHFHAPALPDLCRGAAEASARGVDKVFSKLASELDRCDAPDAKHCMQEALEGADLPPQTMDQLRQLGIYLGSFDLEGQLKGLDSARNTCHSILNILTADRDIRLRSYQTLSLCAGAALVILLI